MRVLSLLLCTIAVTHAANLRRLRNLSSEESVPTITAQYLDLAGEVDTETIHRLITKRKELEERDRAAGGNENDTTQRDLQRDTFAAQNEPRTSGFHEHGEHESGSETEYELEYVYVKE